MQEDCPWWKLYHSMIEIDEFTSTPYFFWTFVILEMFGYVRKCSLIINCYECSLNLFFSKLKIVINEFGKKEQVTQTCVIDAGFYYFALFFYSSCISL